MKMGAIILILILIVSFWIMGNSDWHLNRNKHNKSPKGKLTAIIMDETYKDEDGLVWELQPAIKNKFHQPGPGEKVAVPDKPYPNIELTLAFDPKNPNLKFLSKTESGGSFEVIMQPSGDYLTIGKKMGTYNYGHPEGFLGSLKHTFFDVVPHFINSNYKN
jgi:hypothetical protein